MPDDVEAALRARRLIDDYEARPFYQRNDYLARIGRAKRASTRLQWLEQMLDEIEAGGVYMGMTHEPSRKAERRR